MSEELVEEFITVESIFVRGRNCLALRSKFSPLFTDYYLHLMQYGLRNEELCDSLLKELMAYFTLYMVARPWAEQHAWTVNLRTPAVANLFVTGSSLTESVVGRVFTQDIKEPEENTLYSTLLRKGFEPQYSVVPIPGTSPARWVEEFYRQSEQRNARCIELPDECYTMVTAQPDADEEWLASLTREKMAHLEEDENTRVLETRRFRFYCGCTLDRILPTLKTLQDNKEDLFQGEEELEVTCPDAPPFTVSRKKIWKIETYMISF